MMTVPMMMLEMMLEMMLATLMSNHTQKGDTHTQEMLKIGTGIEKSGQDLEDTLNDQETLKMMDGIGTEKLRITQEEHTLNIQEM